MDCGSCVILGVPLPIISVLRSLKKWELKKITSGSTQHLPIEPLRLNDLLLKRMFLTHCGVTVLITVLPLFLDLDVGSVAKRTYK